MLVISLKCSSMKIHYLFFISVFVFIIKLGAQVTPMHKTGGLGQHGMQSLMSGIYHTCAILDNGSVKCWGYNLDGQLGLGDTAYRGDGANEMADKLPILKLGTNRTARSLVAGNYHTCAILDNGSIKCWGRNTSGQLGLGDAAHRGDAANEMGDNLPTIKLGKSKNKIATQTLKPIGDSSPELFELTGQGNNRTLAAGNYQNCVILDSGKVKCWGRNTSGQLGLGDVNDRGDVVGEMGDNLPVVDLGTNRVARSISVGGNFACAVLDNNSVKCWGNGGQGQLGKENFDTIGDGANEMGDNLTAINLGTNRTVRSLSNGKFHSCAILDNGSVKCWGSNDFGQLGLGDAIDRGNAPNEMGDNLVAINLGTNRTARIIVSRGEHNCAILDDGSVKCWGQNNKGQLGLGDINPRGDGANEMGDNLGVVNLGTNRTVRSLALGAQHSCAVLDNGFTKCWGSNTYGQLGLGDLLNRDDATNEMGDRLRPIRFGR